MLGGMKHLVRRALVGAGLALSVLAAQACAGPTYIVQQYSGEVRDRETIAVIRANGDEDVLLATLDGEDIGVRLERDARLHIEVLPGVHRVGVVNLGDTSQPLQTVLFRAEPGRTYRALFAQGARPVARMYEVERGSDDLIRDVTLPPPAPAETTPPAPEPEPAPQPAPEPAPMEDAGAPAPVPSPVGDGGAAPSNDGGVAPAP